MTLFPRVFLFALLLASAPAHAAGLPDTGQDTCYNDTAADGVAASHAASIARDAGSHPRQDCRYGRDAAAAAGQLIKTGAGDKGFDYSKIANDGSTLAAGAALGTAATDWACTKDNITGLTWEVKVNDNAHLRHQGHTYTWYNSDGATNGGNAGSTGANTCNATLPGNLCNTEAFVAAVNVAALCTYTDWRIPSPRELLTLVHAGTSLPSIDTTYFPNTLFASPFWSGSSYIPNPISAAYVYFHNGGTSAGNKTNVLYVRLVRGGQF
ncbi:MAG: DUF1566 domain-containing protein [Gallionella sp.]|nr:DUF1566 domain-containing protein [Gallionella sp.]